MARVWQNQRVHSNAIRQNQSLRAANLTSTFWSDGVSTNRCSHFAQASRRANAVSQRRAIWGWVSAQEISPRLHATRGSMASSADSRAMDMPLPVTGGIMVMASPMQQSGRATARYGRNERPATAQNEFSSNSADASRWCKGEPVGPRHNL